MTSMSGPKGGARDFPPLRDDRRLVSLSVDECLAALASSRKGLDGDTAKRRLTEFGENVLPRPRRTPCYIELGRNFVHFMALLLWVGAALSWVAGMPELAVAILGVLLINGFFSYFQQYKAERAIDALEALLPKQVRVRRDGVDQMIAAVSVVPGDVLILEEGVAIPADARLLVTNRLRVDASSLTGESRPVARTVQAPSRDSRSMVELPHVVLAGTSVSSGAGEAVVYATGSHTEFGRLASLTQVQPTRPSPLEIEVRRITRVITALAVGMGTLFFVIGTGIGGLSVPAAFLFALGMIVANVPEGLLPTITLALAIGVRRMAARKALVKRLEKVETLGSTTVILTDKTGTLTENEMTVREVWAAGSTFRLTGVGYAVDGELLGDLLHPSLEPAREVLRTAALCCDAKLRRDDEVGLWRILGDPTEAAILVAAAKAGFLAETLSQWPRLTELPFDSTRKRMTTIQKLEHGTAACIKGAADHVADIAVSIQTAQGPMPFDDIRRSEFLAAHDAMACRGMRVLAVAQRDVDPADATQNGWHTEQVEREVRLLGLLAMEDPPRPDVPEAIAACRSAGIRVCMITGDNGLTAATIGREIGLHQSKPIIVEGRELDELDDFRLDRLLDQSELLFARVTPEHKLRLVEAFQRRGDVVAVTGDGVNDAPALRRADVGIAMGVVGTDVARAAADMVLADDHFGSIAAAIEEGRAVYDNVRKFTTYILASNVPEAVPFVVFVLFGIPLPLTVMQILAVDLGTDLLPALALGAESPEADVMSRPPRPRSTRLLDRPTLLRAYAWLGSIEAALGLVAYFFAYGWSGWRPGAALADRGPLYLTATTMSLAAIVSCQMGNVFACRNGGSRTWKQGLFNNRLLWIGLAFELAVLLALIYLPPLARIFGLAPLEPVHWLILVWFGPLLLAFETLRKAITRRRQSVSRRASGHA